MKNTTLKVSRATRPVSAVPTAADAPDEIEMEFKVRADADLCVGEKALFARWIAWRERCRPVTDTDDGSGISIDLFLDDDHTEEMVRLFGRMDSRRPELSVEQFRRFVAALNAVAERLPVIEPTTIRTTR